jgi:hypothetical protein
VGDESVSLLKGALRAGKWVPVARLLAAVPGDFRGRENGLYYAGSGLLVDYLMQPENRDRFRRYFEAERRPGPVRGDDFRRLVGDPAEVDVRLRAHLDRVF